MALIDFKCKDCGEKFFEIIKISDKDKVQCPKCGSREVEQVFEGTASFGANTGKGMSAPRTGGWGC